MSHLYSCGDMLLKKCYMSTDDIIIKLLNTFGSSVYLFKLWYPQIALFNNNASESYFDYWDTVLQVCLQRHFFQTVKQSFKTLGISENHLVVAVLDIDIRRISRITRPKILCFDKSTKNVFNPCCMFTINKHTNNNNNLFGNDFFQG